MTKYIYQLYQGNQFVKSSIDHSILNSIRSNFGDGFWIKIIGKDKFDIITDEDSLDAWMNMLERRHWNTVSFYYDNQKQREYDIDNFIKERPIKDLGELVAVTVDDTGNKETHYSNEEFENFLNNYKNNPIDPKHYKGYVEELQWLDTMSRIPTLRDPIKFEAAVELQIRKYLDRNGQKDESLQELQKALWYLKYLIAYKKAGRPITVGEVDSIL